MRNIFFIGIRNFDLEFLQERNLLGRFREFALLGAACIVKGREYRIGRRSSLLWLL